MSNRILVGMAEYQICRAPNRISTLGLGSCLGVVLYDFRTKVCALGHIMLPYSFELPDDKNRNRFADTCLLDMYHELLGQGATHEDLVAKIAGGARMYDCSSESMDIGSRNVRAVKESLQGLHIPIVAQDTRKTYSRSIDFSPASGELYIRAVGQDMRII